jgi:DNA-binding HxlR family transcriptional regulator
MHGALCPRFHKAIELIGGRWTGPILQLLMGGPARFAELREAIPNISDRMLSERLRELEQEGLVSRHVLPDPPVRVEYDLTEKGKELHASLAAIGKWAERWIPAASGASTRASVQTRKTPSRPRPSARR